MPGPPLNLTRIPITRTYSDLVASTVPITGTITLTPVPKELVDLTSTPITTVVPGLGPYSFTISSATFTGSVIACDDPDLTNNNWTYLVQETLQQGNTTIKLDPWSLFVSVNQVGTLDLSTVVPVDSSPGVVAAPAGLVSWQSKTGPAITDASYLDLVDGDDLSTQLDAQARADGAQTAAQGYADALLTGVSAGGFKGTKIIPSTPYHLLNADNGYLLEWQGAGACSVVIDPQATTAYAAGFSCGIVQGAGAGIVTSQGASASVITIPSGGTASNQNNSTTNTVNMTTPSVIQDGDSILWVVEIAGTRSFSGLPSGFSQIGSAGPANAFSWLFKATNVSHTLASTPLTLTIVGTALVYASVMVVLRGTDTTDWYDGASVSSSTTNTHQTPVVPAAPTAANCGFLSVCGASNAATVYGSTSPFTAGSSSNNGTIQSAVQAATTTATGGNSAIAVGYAGSGGTLTQYAAGHGFGGDTWSVAGNGSAWTVGVKPLSATGAVLLPTDNNSTRTPGSMITLVRGGADKWWAGGPT